MKTAKGKGKAKTTPVDDRKVGKRKAPAEKLSKNETRKEKKAPAEKLSESETHKEKKANKPYLHFHFTTTFTEALKIYARPLYYEMTMKPLDQLVIRYGHSTLILQIRPTREHQQVKHIRRFPYDFAQNVLWSPRGSYLLVIGEKRQTLGIFGGDRFNDLMRYDQPKIEQADFSPGEKYLVTYSKPKRGSDPNSLWLRIFHVLTGRLIVGLESHVTDAPVMISFPIQSSSSSTPRTTNSDTKFETFSKPIYTGEIMASWNSIPLEISYEIVGWIAFASWSISFYPQMILNFRRKSVVGLNFDFVLLNLTKHSSYMIYNVCLYFSPVIQKQYFDTYGDKEMIPVAANDVAFSIHAVVVTAVTLFQIFIYERGPQKVSRFATGLVIVVWGFAAICFFVALPSQSWLWLITIFNSIQVFMTCVKYIPQAKMNFTRKSTVGWSIGNILLDFGGGLANYLQMVIQSIDQNSWVNFYGNIGKTLLSLISIFFDILFMFQHYVLYPEKKASKSSETGRESNEPLIDPSHEHV